MPAVARQLKGMWFRQTRPARLVAHPIARLSLALALLAGSLLMSASGALIATGTSARCTDWNSSVRPPETIWVELYQRSSRGDPAGTRVQVDFKTYVERVVTLEWGPTEVSRAQLMSAALVVKQYAWWYVMHPSADRRDRNGDCFDIGSTTKYQLYREDAATSPARTKLIRAAIEATWSTSVWKTSGRRKGPAHTGYRAGVYAEGCQPGVSGFHLFQQNARKCARLGETAEAIIRRYYGPNIALYDPRAMTIGGLPVGDLWQITPDRRLWSGSDAQPWVSHGRLLPELAEGESSLGISAVDALRTSSGAPGYELIEVRASANSTLSVQRLRPEVAVTPTLDTPWAIPAGWFQSGDRLLLVPGDFDGDLRAELGLLRLRDRESGVSAELAAVEFGESGWSWRAGIWSVADLAAAGVDPWRLVVSAADVNGDGVSDLALLSASSPSDPYATSHPTSLAIASSVGSSWDHLSGIYPDPLLGPAQLIDHFEDPIEQMRLFTIDRNGDGRDELAVAIVDPLGLLRLELVGFPSRSAEPYCVKMSGAPDRCHRLWLRADPALGALDLTTLSVEEHQHGIVRDADGYRQPKVLVLIGGRFSLAGERIYAVDPAGALPAANLTPLLNLLPLGSAAIDR